MKPFFSTRLTPGALGVDRSITGTMAAAQDATGKLTLFFGTGGALDAGSGGPTNAFFAVYIDGGMVRSVYNSVPAGTNFHGGVAYNDGQIIFTTARDLVGTGLCDPTAGSVVAIDANTFAEQFIIPTASKIMAPLFVDRGILYTMTLQGDLVASSRPESEDGTSGGGSGGGGSGGGSGGGTGEGGSVDPTRTLQVIGWRQL